MRPTSVSPMPLWRLARPSGRISIPAVNAQSFKSFFFEGPSGKQGRVPMMFTSLVSMVAGSKIKDMFI
ncbi:hypothetical protein D3C72_2478670 [compost metagenome]